MATRQYIGARYIPVFADPVEWDDERAYEYLTMVQHVGETYMSKQNVPIGAPLPDTGQGEESTEYWVHMSNWNAQVETYRQEVLLYNGRISTLENDLPIADFDNVNTVSSAIANIQNQIGTSFDSTNTVSKAINDEINTRKNQDDIRLIVFDTVTDMKASANLEKDYICMTLGFNSINDNGGAYYLIDDSGTANEMDIISCGDLYAKLIINNSYITPEMFGAFGDGHTDDFASINQALSYSLPILFSINKTYAIEDYFEIDNQITNVIIKNANIKVNANTNNYIFTFNNTDINNFDLFCCKFNGNNNAYGVVNRTFKAVSNLNIENCEIYNMNVLLDGNNFPISYALYAAALINNINDTIVHDNSGHGLMIGAYSASQNLNAAFNIVNCKSYNNGGIGIGSYSDGNTAKVTINNCIAYNNYYSGIAPHGIDETNIINCNSYSNGEHGVVIQQSHKGCVSNCNISNNTSYGVRVQGDYSLNLADRFVENVIVNNNNIDGNGVNVGVSAKNIVVSNNTIVNTSEPFFTDNDSSNIKNSTSKNVSFINNVVDQISYTNHRLNDYFNNLIVKDNKRINGTTYPDGIFIVQSPNDAGSTKAYAAFYDATEAIAPNNTNVLNQNNYNANATQASGVLTVSSNISASNSYIIGFSMSAKAKTTYVVKTDLPITPVVRFRGSGGVLLEYDLIGYNATSGNLKNLVLTTENDLTKVTSVELAFRCPAGLSTGTYAFEIYGADGSKVHNI